MSEKGSWAQVVEKVLEWLKTILPLAVFSAIVRFLKRKAWFAERKVEEKELEVEHYKNKEKVEQDNSDKSDSDIVRDAISEGRRIRTKESSD